jgi:hypothetical protein
MIKLKTLLSEVFDRYWNLEMAKAIADELGATIVGSVAIKGWSNHDLDLRIEDDDIPWVNKILSKRGFVCQGSMVVSPQEAKESGKPYGKGWQRAFTFIDPRNDKIIQVWIDEEEDIKENKSDSNYKPALRFPNGEIEVALPNERTHIQIYLRLLKSNHSNLISINDPDVENGWALDKKTFITQNEMSKKLGYKADTFAKKLFEGYTDNDWNVGQRYDASDVLIYVQNLHGGFEDDDRITGYFDCILMNPRNIPESSYMIDDDKVDDMARLDTEFPPIVVSRNLDIIDGGHRLAASVKRGDKEIKVLKQV